MKHIKYTLISYVAFLSNSLLAEQPTPKINFDEHKNIVEVYAAYTLWVPYQDALAFAYDTGEAEIVGEYYEPEMYANSGFKVGLNANTFHDNIHISINYAWFYQNPALKSSELDASEIGDNTFYEPLFSNPGILEASSKYKIQFNRIDGKFSKRFFGGEYVRLEPWIGFLGAFDTTYLILELEEIQASNTGSGEVTFKQQWWGVGPYIGANCKYFAYGWGGFFVKGGISLLLADHDLYYYETTDISILSNVQNNSFDSLHSVEPMFEIFLGLFLKADTKYVDFSVEVGWEAQSYMAHLGFRPEDPLFLYDRSNFSMQGLTAGVSVCY